MQQIYNTLTRAKEEFKPVHSGQVRMYVCGMTVYDYCHLGHARMLVSFDVVQRWLRVSGLHVEYVRNITDIDDKIIRRSVETGKRLGEVTDFYIAAMHADERALGVQTPDQEPRATQYVGEMLDIIGKLERQGLAYQAQDGDVNFAVRDFPGYGKLSGKTLDDLRAGERVAVGSAKRDPLDFVLWKSAKADEPADSKWESPYGLGRPGWHIECSAMSKSLLGLPLDIHGGGPDLKFPHHENEIAQTEGAFGGQLANVWMHCGPLMVDTEKMSKSLGNFRTIRQTIGQGDLSDAAADYKTNPREAEMLRFFIVRNHYRSAQNYAPDNLIDAQNALDRLYQALQNVKADDGAIDWDEPQARAFEAAMNDDFNTSGAVAALFELASQANRQNCSRSAGQLNALAGLLGLLQQEPADYFKASTRYSAASMGKDKVSNQDISESEIEALIFARAQAKQARNYAQADEIRDTLRNAGVELDDRAGGQTQWRRA